MKLSFNFARTPRLYFGAGKCSLVPSLAAGFGRRALLITGRAAQTTPQWTEFRTTLIRDGFSIFEITASGEPTPEFVDETVQTHRGNAVDVVVAWGGGSVLDAGKAVSAMLVQEGSVADYLEGVGTRTLSNGRKTSLIAVPTTAGTGSETTKNAVLSRIGPNGFKKSLRHDNFVPDIALIDPALALTCPPNITAACGMDAFTQLLEAFVSTQASPLSDAVTLSGLEHAVRSLVRAVEHGTEDLDARADMAYAAYLSGIALANAGLGIVHGLASPIGALAPVPHGVACGTLLAAATEATIRKLAASDTGEPGLAKYARVGCLFLEHEPSDAAVACEALIAHLWEWTERLKMPRLGAYRITPDDVPALVAGSGNKNNAIALDPDEVAAVLLRRI